MYDFKKIRKWLIIISFFVQHIFVAPSIVSNLFLYNNLSKKTIKNSLLCYFGRSCEEYNCKNVESIDKKDFDSEHLFTENFCNKFSKDFISKAKKPKNMAQEIIVCDNRIDRIDENFSKAIYSDSKEFQDRSLVAFA